MNKVYERITLSLFEAKKLMMEGPKYGDSPTQTGRTVGRAMNKFYKDLPGGSVDRVNIDHIAKTADPVHERPEEVRPGMEGVEDLMAVAKKRIQSKVAKRQVKNAAKAGDFAALKVNRQSKRRFDKSYSKARDSGDYRGNPKNN